MNLQRSWSAAIASLSLAVVLLLAILPDPVGPVGGPLRSAFSANNTEECLLTQECHFEGFRAVQDWRSGKHVGPGDTAALPVQLLAFAGIEFQGSQPSAQRVAAFHPQRWRIAASPRAPPAAV